MLNSKYILEGDSNQSFLIDQLSNNQNLHSCKNKDPSKFDISYQNDIEEE